MNEDMGKDEFYNELVRLTNLINEFQLKDDLHSNEVFFMYDQLNSVSKSIKKLKDKLSSKIKGKIEDFKDYGCSVSISNKFQCYEHEHMIVASLLSKGYRASSISVLKQPKDLQKSITDTDFEDIVLDKVITKEIVRLNVKDV